MLTPIRAVLIFVFVLCLLSWWALGHVYRADAIPIPDIRTEVIDPYSLPELSQYKLYQDALAVNDIESLKNLSLANDYLAYEVSLGLSRNPVLTMVERYGFLQRANQLRWVDPIDRQGNREFDLSLAQLAEAAGLTEEALTHYQKALPLPEAQEALNRLEPDPYRRANAFVRAALYREALTALDGRLAPSLEAPSYRRLGDFTKALDAYERWLIEVPASREARIGKAWMHFSLEDFEAAQQTFASLSGADALYGQAMASLRLGDLDRAAQLLGQTGDPDDLWLATGLFEAEERYADALPYYFNLAKGTSKLADDAAYRAYVLAARLGLPDMQAEAYSLLKPESFFALKLGQSLKLPSNQIIAQGTPAVLPKVYALARAGNHQAAKGELLFALKNSPSLEDTLTIAEYLQSFGEYRQSQRAVSLLFSGSERDRVMQDLRAWRLAYPKAYEAEIMLEAQKHALDPALIWAIMRQESAFFPRAVSTSSAKGLMQVIPSTWDWLAELQNEPPGNPFDVSANIRYGSFYLNWLRTYFADYNGDQELIIASYNRGQGYIRRLYESASVQGQKDELYREIDALETREYLQQVSLNYQIYKALYGL